MQLLHLALVVSMHSRFGASRVPSTLDFFSSKKKKVVIFPRPPDYTISHHVSKGVLKQATCIRCACSAYCTRVCAVYNMLYQVRSKGAEESHWKPKSICCFFSSMYSYIWYYHVKFVPTLTIFNRSSIERRGPSQVQGGGECDVRVCTSWDQRGKAQLRL